MSSLISQDLRGIFYELANVLNVYNVNHTKNEQMLLENVIMKPHP